MMRTLSALALLLVGCGWGGAHRDGSAKESGDDFAVARARMVDLQIARRDVTDRRVLDAMRRVPRHRFVPAEQAAHAYEDYPLSIGRGQTISQPYVVAYMTEQLQVRPESKVLEIGTGSGYQAAVLAQLAREVYSIEIVEELSARAEATLRELGYTNVRVRSGDGYRGWPEAAPFDRIIVTAAPDHVPQPLVDQLAVGGRMVIPVGDRFQQITVITKTDKGIVEEKTLDVVFVPMTGEAQKK